MTAFDLYRTTSHGTEWIATFLDIEVARANARNRAAKLPGAYFVVDQCSGDKIFETSDPEVEVRTGRLPSADAKTTPRC
jgi:hypothetical protein